MHCSNEGHLFHFWQRKIAFIKLYGKQNEVMLFVQGILFRRLCSSFEKDPAAETKGEQSDDQKVVLSADLLLNCNKGLFNDSCAFI